VSFKCLNHDAAPFFRSETNSTTTIPKKKWQFPKTTKFGVFLKKGICCYILIVKVAHLGVSGLTKYFKLSHEIGKPLLPQKSEKQGFLIAFFSAQDTKPGQKGCGRKSAVLSAI